MFVKIDRNQRLTIIKNLIGKFLIFVLAVNIIIFSASKSAQSQELQWYKEAIDNYKVGKLSKAKDILKSEAIKNKQDLNHKFRALDLLIVQCLNSSDIICVYEAINEQNQIIDKVHDKTHEIIYKLFYSSIILNLTTEQDLAKLNITGQMFNNMGWMINVDAYHFSAIQLLNARLMKRLGRYEEASDSLKRAIVGFYSIPVQNHYDISLSILNIVSELLEQGETYKAFKWFFTAAPYLETTLTVGSPEYGRFKFMKANLATNVFPISAALVQLYKDAYEATDKVGYNEALRGLALGGIATEYASISMLNGQYAEAIQIIENHPLKEIKEKILQGENNANPVFIMYASAYITIYKIAGRDLDPRWERVLDRAKNKIDKVDWENTAKDYTIYARDYIDFALAILKSNNNIAESNNLFISSALSRIENLKKTRERFSDSFSLVNIWDRVLIEFGVLAGIDKRNADLVISGSEVLDRTFNSYLTDSKSVIAAQENESERQTSRNWLRRVMQRNEFEISYLSVFLDNSMRGLPFDQKEILKNRIDHAAELEIEKEERKSIKGLTDRPILPSLSRLQSSLKKNEVFIKITFAADKLVHYCVKKESYIFPAAKKIDSQKLFLAVKSLENNLNYSGAPNLNGAASYPVDEAKYVWRALTEDLSDCLNNVDNIVFSLPSTLRGIPIESLIIHGKKDYKNNLDDLENDWVGVNWGVAYADSAQSFIVSRETRIESNIRKIPYLGVGNPMLTKEKEMASRGINIRGYIKGSAAPVNFNLEALGNLPSTHDELQLMHETFLNNDGLGSGSINRAPDLLEWDNATERSFRNKTLSIYNIIHFATHALIREELPGLREPSLVFTPDISQNDLNDGILTSSEIANLDLNANIIILSACNTAKTDPQLFGSGLSGLSNAFSFAGVPTILASLWELNDAATKDLVSYYSNNIKRDSSNTAYELHRDSMREFIRRNRGKVFNHPRYWASIIILGDGNLPFIEGKITGVATIKNEILNQKDNGEIFDLISSRDNIITIIKESSALAKNQITFTPYSMDLKGNKLWRLQNESFTAGKLRKSGDKVVVSGFGKDSIIHPEVAIIDPITGKVNKIYNPESSEGISINFYENIRNNSLFYYNVKNKNVNMLLYSKAGNFLTSQELYNIPENIFPYNIYTLKLKNNKVMIAETGHFIKPVSNNLNEYGLVPSCNAKYTSKISFYNSEDGINFGNFIIDDYMITSAIEAKNEKVLLSGMKSVSCGKDGRAAVVLLDKTGTFNELWIETYFPSYAKGAYFLNDNELIVFEEKNEPVELFVRDRQNDNANSISSDDNPIYNSTRTKSILSIVKKNIKNGSNFQVNISSGMNDKIYGVFRDKTEFTAFGSRAGHPHITTYSLQ